jgi:HAD superfamily hydrolase (TIGR01509 family)
MDGLLVDSEPLWWEVERDFARSRGAVWTDEQARACVGRGLRATLSVMRDALGLSVDPATDVGALVDRFIARVGDLALKPGAAELLTKAHGRVGLALASSSPERLIGAVLARFDLAPFFDAVVSGESVSRPKPAPDIFLRAAQELHVAPADCVVLEDSLAGAQAARAAAMRVIVVPDASGPPGGFDGIADAVVPSLVHASELLF